MTSAQLSALIRASVQDAVAAGELDVAVPDTVPVTRPQPGQKPGHATWASTVALVLAPDSAGRSPQVVAGVVAQRLRAQAGIAAAEVAGPGFLNVTVDVAELAQVVRAILERDPAPAAPLRAAELDAGLISSIEFTHSRLYSLSLQAAAHGVTRSAFVPEMLTHETEMALLVALAEADDVSRAADSQRFLQHLGLIAETFQACFAATRLTPRGLDPVTDLHRTRLWLAEATRVVLRTGLHQLGLTAPEHS